MIEEIFKNNNLRLTIPRLLIFQILQKNHHPQSAQNIHAKLSKQVDLASVYRNLIIFEQLNIVQREYKKDEDFFYLAKDQHHHIVCSRCGFSECVPCDHNFKIKNFINIKHELTLTGVCASCTRLV